MTKLDRAKDPRHGMNVACFAFLINTLTTIYPASVTSWFRTEARNRDVGGSPDSLHQIGLAVDLIFQRESDRASFTQAAKRLGLQCVFEGDHLHVEFDHATA